MNTLELSKGDRVLVAAPRGVNAVWEDETVAFVVPKGTPGKVVAVEGNELVVKLIGFRTKVWFDNAADLKRRNGAK